MPALDITFAFYVKVILGLGLTFQMPMLVYFLARFGIVIGEVPRQTVQVRDPDYFHPGGRDHAERGYRDDAGFCRADAGAVCRQHRRGVDFRQA